MKIELIPFNVDFYDLYCDRFDFSVCNSDLENILIFRTTARGIYNIQGSIERENESVICCWTSQGKCDTYKDNKDDLYLSFNIYEKGDIVSFDYMNGDDLIYTHISGEFESIIYTGLGYYNESNIITLKGGKKYLVNDIINLSCDKIK